VVMIYAHIENEAAADHSHGPHCEPRGGSKITIEFNCGVQKSENVGHGTQHNNMSCGAMAYNNMIEIVGGLWHPI
jgi:hypothetical protein